jgi:homoaconitase/3-isopropylmalate dehydratase large subunit
MHMSSGKQVATVLLAAAVVASTITVHTAYVSSNVNGRIAKITSATAVGQLLKLCLMP